MNLLIVLPPACAVEFENLMPGAYEIVAAKYGFSDAKARVVVDARRWENMGRSSSATSPTTPISSCKFKSARRLRVRQAGQLLLALESGMTARS